MAAAAPTAARRPQNPVLRSPGPGVSAHTASQPDTTDALSDHAACGAERPISVVRTNAQQKVPSVYRPGPRPQTREPGQGFTGLTRRPQRDRGFSTNLQAEPPGSRSTAWAGADSKVSNPKTESSPDFMIIFLPGCPQDGIAKPGNTYVTACSGAAHNVKSAAQSLFRRRERHGAVPHIRREEHQQPWLRLYQMLRG